MTRDRRRGGRGDAASGGDPDRGGTPGNRIRALATLVAPTETARGMAPYVGLAACVFLAAAVLGTAAAVDWGSSRILPVRNGNPAVGRLTAWDFFAHNAPIAVVMALGFLVFGLPTVFLLAFNGFVLGSALTEAVANFGVVTTAAAVLPHAVVELPATWLAAGVGFRWLHVIWRVAQGDLQRPILVHVRETLVALLVALALVAVAAWIEATVTDAAIRLVSSFGGVETG